MSEWIQWNGGLRPVAADDLVDVMFQEPSHDLSKVRADSVSWLHHGNGGDIVAYRIVLAPDMVNAPPHYNQGGIECIEAIRAALTPDEFRGHCKANAMKYIWREAHKGQDESIRKAIWYLEEMLK